MSEGLLSERKVSLEERTYLFGREMITDTNYTFFGK